MSALDMHTQWDTHTQRHGAQEESTDELDSASPDVSPTNAAAVAPLLPTVSASASVDVIAPVATSERTPSPVRAPSGTTTAATTTTSTPAASPLGPIRRQRRLTVIGGLGTGSVQAGKGQNAAATATAALPSSASSSPMRSPITINRRRASMGAALEQGGGGLSSANLQQLMMATSGTPAAEVSPANSSLSSPSSASTSASSDSHPYLLHKLKTSQLLNATLQRESQERSKRIATLESEATEAEARRKAQLVTMAELRARGDTAETRLHSSEARLTSITAAHEALRAELTASLDRCAQLQGELDRQRKGAEEELERTAARQKEEHALLVSTLADRDSSLSSLHSRESDAQTRASQAESSFLSARQDLLLLREEVSELREARRADQDMAKEWHGRMRAAEEAHERTRKQLKEQQQVGRELREQLAYAQGVSRIAAGDLRKLQAVTRSMLVRQWVRRVRMKKTLFVAVKRLYRTAADFSGEVYGKVERGGAGASFGPVTATAAGDQQSSGSNLSSTSSSSSSTSSSGLDVLGDLAAESASLGLGLQLSQSPSTLSPSGVSLSHAPIRNDKKHLSRAHTTLGDLVDFLAELVPRLEVVAADAVKESGYWRRMAEAFFQRSIGLKADVLQLQQQGAAGGALGTGGSGGNAGSKRQSLSGPAGGGGGGGAQEDVTSPPTPGYQRSTISHSRRTSLSGLLLPTSVPAASITASATQAPAPAPLPGPQGAALTSASSTPPSLVRSVVNSRGTFTLSGAAAALSAAAKQADALLSQQSTAAAAAAASSAPPVSGTSPAPTTGSAFSSQPPSPDIRPRTLASLSRRSSGTPGPTLGSLGDSRCASPAQLGSGTSTVPLGGASSLARQGSPQLLPAPHPRTSSSGGGVHMRSERSGGSLSLAYPPQGAPAVPDLPVPGVAELLPTRRPSLALLPTLDSRPGAVSGSAGAPNGLPMPMPLSLSAASNISPLLHPRRGSFSLDVAASVADTRAAVLSAAAAAQQQQQH